MTTVPVSMRTRARTNATKMFPERLDYIVQFIRSTLQLILDRISKGINDKVNGQAPLQKAIFKFAYDYKRIWTQRGYETPILDKYVHQVT